MKIDEATQDEITRIIISRNDLEKILRSYLSGLEIKIPEKANLIMDCTNCGLIYSFVTKPGSVNAYVIVL